MGTVTVSADIITTVEDGGVILAVCDIGLGAYVVGASSWCHCSYRDGDGDGDRMGIGWG